MVNEASKSSKNKMKKNNNNNNSSSSNSNSNNGSNGAGGENTTVSTTNSASSKSKRKSNEYENEKKQQQQQQLQQQQMNGNHHNLDSNSSNNSNDDDDINCSESSGSDSNSLITQELETASRDENTYSSRNGVDQSVIGSSTSSTNNNSGSGVKMNSYRNSGNKSYATDNGISLSSSSNDQQLQEIDLNLLNDIGDESLNHHHNHYNYHNTNNNNNNTNMNTGAYKSQVQSTYGKQQQQHQQQSSTTNQFIMQQQQQQGLGHRNAPSSVGKSQNIPNLLNSINNGVSGNSGSPSSKAGSGYMQQMNPQRLDNVSLETLDQNICHLILDEKEILQVKSPEEFINLFKNSKPSSINEFDGDETNGISLPQATSQLPTANTNNQTDDRLVECVSIFGNTGDGKSHTLNETFFNGRPIFRTSSMQETCTMGVWCAYDPNTKALIFDTEGLLGTSTNENTRMRLLLKVLAISDVVIYRTRAERLHNDLFQFLSDASVAYTKYFKDELKMAQSKLKLDTISSLGPRCIIFHETQHTDILSDEIDANGQQRTVSHQLTERFAKLKLSFDAFSSMDYVGTRTYMKSGSLISDNSSSMATDFTKLAQTVRDYLHNNSVRPPRKISSIYQALKALNDKFSGKMPEGRISTFADEYFTCSSVCLSCNKRCQNSINHLKDGVPHYCSSKCHYDHQYDNKVYVCKQCHEHSGKEVIVIPKTAASNENSLIGIVKYAFSGFVLECPHHGIIYRSRQYWYGNQEPESVVRTELKHIWSGQVNNVGTSHNLSRKIIDGVSYLGESLHSVSAKPTKMAMQWMADKVAPTYWIPNSEIFACHACQKSFADLLQKKHHCRGCGKGFCDKCSAKRKIISWWSLTDPVRVCDVCYDTPVIPEPPSLINTSVSTGLTNSPNYGSNGSGPNGTNNSLVANSSSTSALAALALSGNNDVMARKVTETVQDTIGFIGYATKIPFVVLKETARPSYWKPDSECTYCSICKLEFDDLRPLHHCRSCGDGVCHACSPRQKSVPSRGWDTPVRVCNNCMSNELNMDPPS